ncbi:MAG: transposase [Elusimicrobiota bacterium]
MARPLRISYEGAVYHLTSRGNNRGGIFRTVKDRQYFLQLLAEVAKRYQWLCYAYCLMDNHYHLVMETVLGNVSKGMRQLNGEYTQYFNFVHKRVGHLFQGRFKGILVEKDSHLLEVCRYVVLNPVRAKMCQRPSQYGWSSYQATVGLKDSSLHLNRDWLLSQFGKQRKDAIQSYVKFVEEGLRHKPWDELKGQIYFGSEKFIKNLQASVADEKEIPRVQRQPIRPSLSEVLTKSDGMLTAYKDYGYSLKEIAQHLGVHYATVSRRLKRLEGENV